LNKIKKKNIKGLVKIELGFEKVQYKIIILPLKKSDKGAPSYYHSRL